MSYKKIKNRVIKLLEGKAEYIAESSCYNYHNNKFRSKNSRLYKDFQALPKIAKHEHYFVVVGAIGKSTHSKTQLLIFKVDGSNCIIGSYDVGFRHYWYLVDNHF